MSQNKDLKYSDINWDYIVRSGEIFDQLFVKQLNTYLNKHNFAAKDYKLKKKEKADRICAHYLLKRDEERNSGVIEAHDEAGTSDILLNK